MKYKFHILLIKICEKFINLQMFKHIFCDKTPPSSLYLPQQYPKCWPETMIYHQTVFPEALLLCPEESRLRSRSCFHWKMCCSSSRCTPNSPHLDKNWRSEMISSSCNSNHNSLPNTLISWIFNSILIIPWLKFNFLRYNIYAWKIFPSLQCKKSKKTIFKHFQTGYLKLHVLTGL